MNAIFSASLMCVKPDHLKDTIQELEDAGVDRMHLDFMDGVFVPNYSLGLQDVETVCRLSSVPCELHLMTVNPGRYISKFSAFGVDVIYIHPESDYHPSTALSAIIASGVKPGIVLSPGTSVESVKDLLRIARYVLVMTVNPGEAGQAFLPFVCDKIQQLLKLKREYGFEIELDGACSQELIERYFQSGVDGFVLGTAALFHNRASYADSISKLRSITNTIADGVSNPTPIRVFVTDIDGTLTDGKIYMGNYGEVMKAFNIKDGYALHELLPEHCITPVIVTGRTSQISENRAAELGVVELYQGISDKAAMLRDLAQKFDCGLENIAYIGDDDNDIGAMKIVGLAGCPSDASENVKRTCDYICSRRGGEGAVREFADNLINIKINKGTQVQWSS